MNINLDNNPQKESLSEAQCKFTYNIALLINHIFDAGYYATFGEAFRTENQAKIYAKQGLGIVNSQHCKRLAVDLNIFSPETRTLCKSEDYSQFGAFWINLDPMNKWGGNFVKNGKPWPDIYHFEMRG